MGNKVVEKRSMTNISYGVIIATSPIIQETCTEGYMESLKGGAKETKFQVITNTVYKSQLNQLRIMRLHYDKKAAINITHNPVQQNIKKKKTR